MAATFRPGLWNLARGLLHTGPSMEAQTPELKQVKRTIPPGLATLRPSRNAEPCAPFHNGNQHLTSSTSGLPTCCSVRSTELGDVRENSWKQACGPLLRVTSGAELPSNLDYSMREKPASTFFKPPTFCWVSLREQASLALTNTVSK